MKNREIKFRAWEVLESKVYYQVRVGGVFDGEPTSPTTYIKDKVWVNLIGGEYTKVMQYTGIHDCNGKEIWEGDIVALNGCTHRYAYINYFDGKYEIRFSNSAWWLDRHTVLNNKVKIIGNVFENPELLNKNINL